MVFRRLRKRGRDRARSSEWRRLGKAFQKDGPTTAKLLRWAVASLTLGTTRSPCSAERRDLRPGKDDTGVTGQNIPPAGLYPGLKRPRLDYTRVYYGLGQFITSQTKLYIHYINHDKNIVERYAQEIGLINFSTSYYKDSVLSDSLS